MWLRGVATRHTLSGVTPLTKIILLVAIAVTVLWLLRMRRPSSSLKFTPVDQLSSGARLHIEEELDAGHLIAAVKLYRDATGSGLREAKVAVEQHAARRGGPR